MDPVPDPTAAGSVREAAPTLLLVEDDPQLLGMLREVLTEEGYAVSTARDAQRALHLALTGEFDLMVLDRGLPVKEGLGLLTRLRAPGHRPRC